MCPYPGLSTTQVILECGLGHGRLPPFHKSRASGFTACQANDDAFGFAIFATTRQPNENKTQYKLKEN